MYLSGGLVLKIYRMEIVDIKKVRCQAKVIGTIVTVAGAMLMTLYKGNVIHLIWSEHVHSTHSSSVPETTNKDWIKGSILLIIATFAWASFFILQVNNRMTSVTLVVDLKKRSSSTWLFATTYCIYRQWHLRGTQLTFHLQHSCAFWARYSP